MTYQLDNLRKLALNQSPNFIISSFVYYDWVDDDNGLSANAISSWATGLEDYCTMRVVFTVTDNVLQSITIECTPKEQAMTAYVVFDVNEQEHALVRWVEFLATYNQMRQAWLGGHPDSGLIEVGDGK